MKLQMLKEQVIKEMRQIKKTAFVGFPECTHQHFNYLLETSHIHAVG